MVFGASSWLPGSGALPVGRCGAGRSMVGFSSGNTGVRRLVRLGTTLAGLFGEVISAEDFVDSATAGVAAGVGIVTTGTSGVTGVSVGEEERLTKRYKPTTIVTASADTSVIAFVLHPLLGGWMVD